MGQLVWSQAPGRWDVSCAYERRAPDEKIITKAVDVTGHPWHKGSSTGENDMTDTTHLVALTTRLHNERRALAATKISAEIALRKVWVAQIEREINGEERFLGMTETDWNAPEMSDDDLLAELTAA
jgi:hypothetical protein